jgi:hypothetical protein
MLQTLFIVMAVVATWIGLGYARRSSLHPGEGNAIIAVASAIVGLGLAIIAGSLL